MRGNIRPILSLRTMLTSLFILLVALTAGLIGAISLQNGQRAAEDLAYQLQDQTLVGVAQKLGDYLAMPHMLNRLNVDMVRQNPAGIADLARLRAQYIQQLRAFDPVMTVAIGVEASGEYVGVGRRDGNTYESGVMQRAVDNTYRVDLLDSQGKPLQVLTETPNYDARTRAWYQAGAKAGKAAWSPIYVWASQTNIGITAVLPIYDDTGVLLGVQQSALSLRYIGDFLASLKIGQSGRVFLMERAGLLVASSAPEKPIRQGQNSADFVRFKATESDEPFTRAAAGHLTAQFADLSAIPADYQTRIDVAGQRYFVSTAGLRDPHGLDWLLVVGVPESDFLARVTANTRTTIFLCVIAALAALVLGIHTADRITRPILGLNAAAKELAQGRWDQKVTVKRRDEVGELAESFNWMAAQLGELFTGLEQRVAQRTQELEAVNGELRRDVVERRQVEAALGESEKQYRDLFQNSLNGLSLHEIVTDAHDQPVDYVFLQVNRAFEELTGLNAGAVIGRPVTQVLPGIEQTSLIETYGRVALTGKPIRFEEFSPQLNRYYEIAAFSSAPRQFAVIFADITERKRTEDALRQAKADLERSNADLQQFAYVVSHDLQEPLRMVTGFLGLLAEDTKGRLDASADEFIGYAVDGATRMRAMIEGLLDLSRVATWASPFAPTDCEALLTGVLRSLQLAIEDSNAVVTHDPLPTVLADEAQLAQVFQNLIANALKFHGAEPPVVHISARQTFEVSETSKVSSAPVWEFAVRDHGIGMDPAQAKHIFGIFQRLHTRDEYPGAGIGLATCKKIVERHGGRIWVESALGQGATFYFTLPATQRGES